MVIDGFKLRTLFAVPHADDRRFFYGSNFEFSFNAKYWDPKRFSSEIRPIVGWHLHPVDIVINPIVDTEYDGIKNLEFVPSTRVAYNVSSTFAVAAETYSDFGPVRGFLPRGDQAHHGGGHEHHQRGHRVQHDARDGLGPGRLGQARSFYVAEPMKCESRLPCFHSLSR